ncbi:hypothetical protein [Candidatus Methanomassiliicoccus intestinalis]
MSPTITLTDASIAFAPKFTVSPWKMGEYNSINGVYTSTVGSIIIGFTTSWEVGQIPGITISAYGSSVQSGNSYINAVDNGDGTYSYYFRLSGMPTTKGVFDVRNTLLPPQIKNGMWFNFTVIDDSSDAPPSTKSHSNKIQYNNQLRVSISSAIEFMGATWAKNKQKWQFEYRMAGIGHTNYIAGINDRISYARILIKSTQNQSNIVLWSTPDVAQYKGSTPASLTGTDYSGIANTVIGLALNANPWASLIWGSASAIVALLASFVNSSADSSQSLERSWSWWPLISDTSQFFWFDVLVEPNEMVEFSYEYTIIGNPFELLGVKGYRQLYAGPPGVSSSTNPEKMTFIEREQYGIKTITRENILTKDANLNVSEKTLKDWLDSGEEVLYYTNNFVECEKPQPEKFELNESALIKDLLLEELHETIDRSRLIIEAFSTDEICNTDEGKATIKKHTDMLESLLNVQKSLDSTQNLESIELSKIFDAYLKITDAGNAYLGRVKK